MPQDRRYSRLNHRLDQHGDVNVSSPTDGQVLTYQASTDSWVPATTEPLPAGTQIDASLRWNGSTWVEDTSVRHLTGGELGFFDGTAQSQIGQKTDGDFFIGGIANTRDLLIENFDNVKFDATTTLQWNTSSMMEFTDGTTLVGDPDYPSVELLLSFDGLDAATSTTDESSAARTVTFIGNAQLDTAQSVFGGSSLLLDGNGDYLTIADSADFSLGSGDFTIECRVRFASIPMLNSFWASHYNPSGNQRGWLWGFSGGGNILVFTWTTDGSSSTFDQIDYSWSPVVDTWYAVAITRSSNTFRLFIDGTLVATEVKGAGPSIHNSTRFLAIGASGTPTDYWDGWIDEFRFTPGVARYTASYTLATAEFPAFENDIVLGQILDIADVNTGLRIRGNVGFYNTTPVEQSPAYTVTNLTTDRTFDANSTSTAELADVLGTLIKDIQATGLIG